MLMQRERPIIAIYRFFKDYANDYVEKTLVNPTTGIPFIHREQVPGKMREVHKVEYGPIGTDKTKVTMRVEDLRPKLDPGMDPQPGSAAENALIRWEIISAAYEKWLAGQEIGHDGTPLAAWSGVSPEQAEVLRQKGLHTVQELAALSETHFDRIGLGGIRKLRDQAKLFLGSVDATAYQYDIEQRDIVIAGLQDNIANLTETLKQMQHTMANLQMAQQEKAASEPVDPDDDAFSGPTADMVKVDTPRKQARGRQR